MSDLSSSDLRQMVRQGQGVLGIEMGSTRIKAILTGPDHSPIASGSHDWENRLENGIWTYSLEEVWAGLQGSVAALQADLRHRCGEPLRAVQAMGISGMMHGYLPFDAGDRLLVPFRTWRNNFTGRAAEELTGLFQHPIPQRWSIAHLYHAILNSEDHVPEIAHLTTLAGYVHWQLTGRRVLGVGEASGMFPIDAVTAGFSPRLLKTFDDHLRSRGLGWQLADLLPEVLSAGEPAGELTPEGARLLDPEGNLEAGAPLCPPEGDAGTGMVATNSVKVRTGNVSAGTSVFAMLVLEKELARLHPEIDLVTTPDGHPVAMAHSNNCTSDTDAWISLFGEVARALGMEANPSELYGRLLPKALEAEADGGGLLNYGYISGEHVTGFAEGRPLFVRGSESSFTLANFMRTLLFSSLCALRTGLNILLQEEQVAVDEIRGHGGFFKTADLGPRLMAAATGVPVSVLATAGEGGAWGIALLAAYRVRENRDLALPDFLDEVFARSLSQPVLPDPTDVEGFQRFFERYHRGLPIERAAVDHLA